MQKLPAASTQLHLEDVTPNQIPIPVLEVLNIIDRNDGIRPRTHKGALWLLKSTTDLVRNSQETNHSLSLITRRLPIICVLVAIINSLFLYCCTL
jgi:hypothetical protein